MQVLNRFFIVFALGFLMFLHTPAVEAAPHYTIKKVLVEKKGMSPSKAKQVAIKDAYRKAYSSLLEVIVPEKLRPLAPSLTDSELTKIVAGIEIAEEKIGQSIYRAIFNVNFDYSGVQERLREAGINEFNKMHEKLIVIPIMQDGDNLLLWEKENIWKKAWEKLAQVETRIALTLPLGDLEDIGAVGVEDAFSGKFDELNNLAEKYEAEKILIAEAVFQEEPYTGRPSVQVIMRLVDNEVIINRLKASFDGGVQTSKEDLYTIAAVESLKRLEGNWSDIVNSAGGKKNASAQSIDVVVRVDNVKQWVEFKKKVLNVEGVKDIEPISVGAKRSEIILTFVGDFSSIQYFLHNAGYPLMRNEEGSWEINIRK